VTRRGSNRSKRFFRTEITAVQNCRKHLYFQTNGVFQLNVSNEKQTAIWTIDMKKTGTVYKGPATPKADVTLILSDDVFTQLAEGKVHD
jgi:hypothetical protein